MTSRPKAPHVPPSGVWCPAVTLFDPDTDTLDIPSQKKYFALLARSGLAGLLVLGTNAETFLLTREERKALLVAAREACGPSFPIMAGVSGHSTAQVLEFIADAHSAGADYVLVLPPGYFGAALAPPAMLRDFFCDVSLAAWDLGMGTVIYNFPGVTNGIDFPSSLITALARENAPRIVGVKLTCGSVAKVTRLAASLPAAEFAIFGGQSDFLVGALAVGGAGCIAAFANVFPRTVVEVYRLWTAGRWDEALALHARAALAEEAVKSGGVAAVKFAAGVWTAGRAGVKGAEGRMGMRRPYLGLGEGERKGVREALEGLAEVEGGLWEGDGGRGEE
ncbi:hypothetical protein B0T18DRAFT_327605 [Schizothecium vesticola]|uniref:Dihydrodipicolinate synthase n=1 Tax=Schizothecium vesticola TaxID=314040 RepID=A0AA40EQ32_9PEZI|nr:hypothetical protein B0T18DRAFT_327605 [Schizothecium vesticola]